MNNPLVSIIVPVFNVKKYLDQCVNSILCQTYNNLEVLLIDDGSTDGSGLICEKFAAEDERIQVFHGINRGLSAARNIGIQKSKGQWVTFVDSDDLVHPEMVETLLNAALEKKAQVIIGETITFIDDVKGFQFENDSNKGYTVKSEDCVSLLDNLLNNKMRKSIWGMLFNIELVRKVYFSEGRLYEDIPYLPLVLKKRPAVIWINKVIYAYRINPESITHREIDKKSVDRIIMKELQVRRIERFFPELRALAIGGLYADCMVWWMKADESDDIEAGNYLKQAIRRCIRQNPLTWDIIISSRIPIGRRLSLLATKLNFVLACRIKNRVIHIMNQ